MTTIVTRAGKGSALTNSEMDSNTVNLKATADAALPKAGGAMTGAITTNSVPLMGETYAADGTKLTTALAAKLPKAGGAMTGAITTNSTFDGRDVATDGAKLDGIESSADVTDATNVTAAGALMDSELTGIAHVKSLNQALTTSSSLIDVFPPEQQAQIRAQISSSLKMVVTQRLLKTKDGQGRQDGDIVFAGNDGGSTITALTLDMSAAGAATFNSSVTASGTVTTENHFAVIPPTTTNYAYMDYSNAGGSMYVGRERSSASGLLTGSTAYAGVINVIGGWFLTAQQIQNACA